MPDRFGRVHRGRRALASAAWATAASLLAVSAAAMDSTDAPNWTFEVADLVELGVYEHVVSLRPSPQGLRYPRKCPVFVVHARLQLGAGVTSETARLFTERGYERAIRVLRAAHINAELVRFGSIDAGFGLIPDKPECEVASRGLGIALDFEGHPAVYSVY